MKRRYFAHYALMLLGVLFITGAAAVMFWYAALLGVLGESWKQWTTDQSNLFGSWWTYNEDAIKFFGAAIGSILTIASGSLALLKSWHYADINLPQRLSDWVTKEAQAHDRGRLLRLGQEAYRDPTFPYGTADREVWSRIKTFFSGPHDAAKIFARSRDRFLDEVEALRAATKEAEARLATAHLLHANFHVAHDRHDKAFDEFNAAAQIATDDLDTLDKTAAYARRLHRYSAEINLLRRLRTASEMQDKPLIQAKSLRREAELLIRTEEKGNWVGARDLLYAEKDLLRALPADADAEVKRELGRSLCLFCEVQTKRGYTRALSGSLLEAAEYLSGCQMSSAPGEEGGQEYGQARVEAARLRIEQLDSEADANEATGSPTPQESTGLPHDVS